MNIGITCYPTVGGSGAVATELGLWLAGRGHKVHFITTDLPFRLRENYHENVYCHKVILQSYNLLKNPPYTLALAVKMAEVAQWEKLDLLHVHYAIPHAVCAFLAREMLGGALKFVTTLHGTDVTLIGQDPSYTEITRMAIERSDAVTAVSASLRAETYETFRTTRPIEVIPNFIDPRRFHPDIHCDHFHPQARDGEKILVHASNFRNVKKVDDVVRIFHIVQESIPARLFFIGEGEAMPLVRKLCRDFGITDKVEFLGEQESVACILPRCDLFLLPSWLESFGLAALEAMACGVPVVASKVGGLPDVVEDGVQGRLLRPGDVEGMAAAAVEILDSVNLPRYREACVRLSRERFDIAKIGPRYESLYQKLAGKP